MSEIEGTFRNLLGSIQSHFEDRLKSPFAGAFVIAWLVHNWQHVLLLCFSDSTIEHRISLVRPFFLSPREVLWTPLKYAFFGVLIYYVISVLFVVVFELYGIMRRCAERFFDNFRWVPPAQYLELKRGARSMQTDLTELASDHLEKISTLTAELGSSSVDRAALGETIERHTTEIEKMSKALVDLKTREKDMSLEISALLAQIEGLSEELKTESHASEHFASSLRNIFARVKSALMSRAVEIDPERYGRTSDPGFVMLDLTVMDPPQKNDDALLVFLVELFGSLSSALKVAEVKEA